MVKKNVLLCGALAAVLLTACSGGKAAPEPEAGNAADAQEASTKEFSYPMAKGDPITWWKALSSGVALEFPSMNDTPYAIGMMERTGVDIDFQHPPAGQEKEQFGLLLADGNLPDLLEYNYLVDYPGGPEKALEDGVVQPLNDIIDKYCPNLKAYLEANPDIDKMIKTDSGQYYIFPMIRSDKGTYQLGPMMRKDWLDELGMEAPATVDEWHTVLTAFKEKKGAISPLIYEYNHARIGRINPIAMAYLPSIDFYVGADGTVHYGSMEEGYKSYLETFSKWYQEGLVDIDIVSLKNDQVAARMTSGQAGASIGLVEGNLGQWTEAGKKLDPEFKLVGMSWPSLKKGELAQGGYCENRYPGYGSVAITTSCKDVERAARLLDYGYSEEGNLYMNFGAEGISYELVDGEPTFTDVILKNPDGWSQKTATSCHTASGSNGAYCSDNRAEQQLINTAEKKEAIFEKWPQSDIKKYLLPPVTPSSDESRELATIMNEISVYRDEMTIKFIMGQESLDTFEEYVATIKKLGIDRALEIQAAALERYNLR